MTETTEHAIATPHVDASRTGAEVLASGGNAIDAALAAAAVLTVAYPHNCALGGDLFALVRRPDGGVLSVNASGPAGAGVDARALRAAVGATMPVTGPHTVTVPGMVAGWGALHGLGASRPWHRHLERATELAAEGVAVADGLADAISESPGVRADPGMAAVFTRAGTPLRADELVRQPALACTLGRLAADGPRAFYDGELADTLAAGLARAGCAVTAADLRAYDPVVEPPLRRSFAGVEVLTSAPNSSGVLLLQALAALEALAPADPLGADAGQLASILRSGSAQRDRMLADPAFVAFDREQWLGERRIEELVTEARHGLTDPEVPLSGTRPDGDTVAVVTVDADGGAVSLIQSLYHSFGAQILEPVTGVLFHNRGASFSLDPGHPNALGPRRRPAHTLMPVMARREERLLGVLGTMGGRVQAQIHVQVLLRLLEGATPQDAVDAPRWVVGALEAGEQDGTVRIEEGVESDAQRALRVPGLTPLSVPRGSDDVGHAQAIWTEREPAAGSDARADGMAICG
ncbi:MAG: Gamma-glutamyltransferase [Solirubrobacterales bacterium]|nr:Gamma-glutamyltransferase [Solirubrobacterales bacterium]